MISESFQVAGNFGLAPGRSAPSWLPVPAPAARPRSTQASPARSRLSARGASHSGAEKFWLLILVLAALFGIAYGFSCLLDLVQHWAAFNAGVAHLLQ
jgi:hypothetical protein